MSLTTDPKVSVVIPTRNRLGMLWRALDSVLLQGRIISEVIIVDDCSTDLTHSALKLLTAYDDRIKVLRTERRIGGAGARNLGASHSKEEFIAFLDDDDIWLGNKIKEQIDYLKKFPSCSGVVCSSIYLDLLTGHSYKFRLKRLSRRELILHGPCPGSSTLLVRRHVFFKLFGFNESLERLQDWDFYLRLLENHEIGILSESLILQIKHSSIQITKQKSLLYSSYRRIYFSLRGSFSPAERTFILYLLLTNRGTVKGFSLMLIKIRMKILKFLCQF